MATTKITEAYLEGKLVQWAKSVGGLALKGAVQFDTGYPDRIIYVPGGHAHVEVKGTSTRYHLSDKQMLWAGRVIASETPYFIIENAEQLKEFIGAFKDKFYSKDARNIYRLNGFNLVMEITKDWQFYTVYVADMGSRRILFGGVMDTMLATTIYKIFKRIEEYYPKTNYADL